MAVTAVTAALLAVLPAVGVGVAQADSGGPAAQAKTLSAAQRAAAQAMESGEPVEVTSERTEYSTTYADPDGTSFTLDQSAVPVRVKRADGSWAAPDPTLETRSDGSVGPKAAVVDLAFSSGGDGSGLVDIAHDGHSLRLGWPGTLPVPVLDGSSATYADVLPGVDLRMTASAEGFRELLVVKTPQAGANPELGRIEFPLTSDGLTVAQTGGGGMSAVDADGHAVFSGPAAAMWDSQGDNSADTARDSAGARATKAARGSATAAALDPTDPSSGGTDDPTTGPGEGDASAVLPVQVGGEALAVVPDAALLANPDAGAFPVYIDPSIGLDQTAHTQLRSDGVTNFNWGNGSNNEGEGMGHCDQYDGYVCGPGYTERLYFQFSPANLAGKKVLDTTFRDTESWSFTCDARFVDLLRTTNISSATTWAGRPDNLGTMASRDVSAGRGSACSPSQPAAPIEFHDSRLTSAVNDFAAGKFDRLTLLLKARDEGDTSAWKRFLNNAVLSVTYVGLPAAPKSAGIVAGSGVSCETNSSDPQVIGEAKPNLTAKVETAAGGASGASLRAHFYIQQQNSDGTWSVATEPVRPSSGYIGNNVTETDPSPVTLAEGKLSRLAVFTQSFYDGGASFVESHSTVTTTGWCYFKVDTTAPKPPVVTVGSPYTECTSSSCIAAGGPGVGAKFTFGPATGDVNLAYEYKLGSGGWSQPITGASVQPTVTPQLAGTQVLLVRAMDGAGWGQSKGVTFSVKEGQTASGRWRFNDGAPNSGVTTAADTATEGIRHPATLFTGGAGWSSLARGGSSDESLWLNDTTNTANQQGYAETAGPVVNAQSSFTVSSWAYLTDSSVFRTVVSETGSDNSGFSLYYSSSIQKWVFLWSWNENGVHKFLGVNSATVGVPLKVWTHLTGVYDAPNHTLTLYVNGRPQSAPVALPATSGASVSDGKLEFGRRSAGSGTYSDYWSGRVDETAVWQRTLTANEIATEDRLLTDPTSDGSPSSVELMGSWNPDGAAVGATTLADATSGYGRSLTLSGGASLDGQAIVLGGPTSAATTPGPVIDDTASFTVSTKVDADENQLLAQPVGYTAQVIGQRSADGSAWGFWYQRTGTGSKVDPDTGVITPTPEGYWWFGRLNADNTFDGVRSNEVADLGSSVRLTGTFDAPSRVVRFYLSAAENDADVTHTYTAVIGSGAFAVGEGHAAGDSDWAHYLPGKITDIRLWAGAMTNQQQIVDAGLD
ncbi:LamG domain-containing protein [Streptomyces sp. NBC_01476]|uniref:LamG domain-containing protein n=1 Tax=Streptomyces sp. NBC_01476 TaxID=2903881 RepID=UPI002E35EBAF|nr:LamG domain-containing protein [Streptomyces sp. NBC_01476]